MSIYIDRKYVSLLSTKLDRFAKKGDYLWNCRCPFCGDSRKNKIKARGYFYRTKTNIFFTCHNCHVSVSLGNFLKSRDPSLYSQYQLEKYQEGNHSNVAKPDFSRFNVKPVFNKKKSVVDLPTIESLSEDHPAKQYCVSRKLPRLNELYYAEDFLDFINKTFPDHGKDLPKQDQRLIIPFLDWVGELEGVQGRTLTNSKIRYITIKKDETFKKVFGLNNLDVTKPIFVVEGPLDSTFLSNAVATMDSSLVSIIRLIGDYDYVFIHDNEPRNKEIIKQMEKSIDSGKAIVIWPDDVSEKDINDMVIAGRDVTAIIKDHTYSGLRAKLEMQRWRKV